MTTTKIPVGGWIISAVVLGSVFLGGLSALAPREMLSGTPSAAPVHVAEEAPTRTVEPVPTTTPVPTQEAPKTFDPVEAARTISPAALYTFVKAVQSVWPLEEKEAFAAGFEVCVKRSNGQDESQIRNELTQQPGVSSKMAIVLVARAQQALCPEYR